MGFDGLKGLVTYIMFNTAGVFGCRFFVYTDVHQQFCKKHMTLVDPFCPVFSLGCELYEPAAVGFRMLADDELDPSILARIGNLIAWIFAPLGWGTWQAAVASITGLVAKENIVGTMGILYGSGDTTVWQALAQAFN